MTLDIEIERNEALLTWYRAHARELPWRQEPDPYRVLVSEFMLQQTQAARVVPFYERFVAAYPSIEELAAAALADVISLWSGLGYNTRAKRLRETARIIADRGWPSSVDDLQQLPGVGPYTASAIASIAFGKRVPALDTNVRRVLSRWHGEPLDGRGLRLAAETDLADDAGAWNQALMDLGASVCRPRQPRCDQCPVENWCSGPEAYLAPAPQARFEGSARQLRGSIMRAAVKRPHTFEQLRRETGFPTDEIEMALEDLTAEGLIALNDDTGEFRIAD
jgi:A/G-specific adenine glycosylase